MFSASILQTEASLNICKSLSSSCNHPQLARPPVAGICFYWYQSIYTLRSAPPEQSSDHAQKTSSYLSHHSDRYYTYGMPTIACCWAGRQCTTPTANRRAGSDWSGSHTPAMGMARRCPPRRPRRQQRPASRHRQRWALSVARPRHRASDNRRLFVARRPAR